MHTKCQCHWFVGVDDVSLLGCTPSVKVTDLLLFERRNRLHLKESSMDRLLTLRVRNNAWSLPDNLRMYILSPVTSSQCLTESVVRRPYQSYNFTDKKLTVPFAHYILLFVREFWYISIYLHTYIHTYIHTNKHTYIYTLPEGFFPFNFQQQQYILRTLKKWLYSDRLRYMEMTLHVAQVCDTDLWTCWITCSL